MIITLSGVTGSGKSYFKRTIEKELGLDTQVIYTTRPIRNGEINGVDKFFVTNKEFDELEKSKKIIITFEYLGYKYGYSSEKMKSQNSSIIELHYKVIKKLKKEVDKVFSIYIIPKDINIAKEKLKYRALDIKQEELRLNEIDEQTMEFKKNEEIRKQFDLIFYNNYNKASTKKLIEIIKNKLNY